MRVALQIVELIGIDLPANDLREVVSARTVDSASDSRNHAVLEFGYAALAHPREFSVLKDSCDWVGGHDHRRDQFRNRRHGIVRVEVGQRRLERLELASPIRLIPELSWLPQDCLRLKHRLQRMAERTVA